MKQASVAARKANNSYTRIETYSKMPKQRCDWTSSAALYPLTLMEIIMLAIFNDEISTLEQQLAAITAQIEALKIAETKAEQAKAYLIDLIDTVQPLGKLEEIKRLVLALFGSDDNGDGNTPSPEPTPSGDDGELTPIEQAIATITTAEIEAEDTDATDNADAPTPTLEEVEIKAEQQSNDYAQLIAVNEQLAYFQNYKGYVMAVYCGFRTKAIASSWLRFLEVFNCASELRLSQRMTGYKWEVKVKGLSLAQITRLAEKDLTTSYRSELAASMTYPKVEPRWFVRVNGRETFAGNEQQAREHYQQARASTETTMAKLCNNNYEVVEEFENLEALKASIEPEPVQTEPEYTLELDSDDYLSGETFWCSFQGKRIGKVYASISQPGLFRHSRQRDNSTFDSKEAAANSLVARHRTELATHQRTTALFNPLAS